MGATRGSSSASRTAEAWPSQPTAASPTSFVKFSSTLSSRRLKRALDLLHRLRKDTQRIPFTPVLSTNRRVRVSIDREPYLTRDANLAALVREPMAPTVVWRDTLALDANRLPDPS